MKQSKQARYQEGLARLKQRVLRDPAVTTPKERQAAFAGGAEDPTLASYLKQVQDAAYRVTDEEVAALLTRFSEDALFELTTAAALGAATKRIDAGLRVIEGLEE